MTDIPTAERLLTAFSDMLLTTTFEDHSLSLRRSSTCTGVARTGSSRRTPALRQRTRGSGPLSAALQTPGGMKRAERCGKARVSPAPARAMYPTALRGARHVSTRDARGDVVLSACTAVHRLGAGR